MLLIAANTIKALGYLVYPAVELATGFGSKPISLPLCLACGFNIAWGIEATDFAILLIALHTALTVFRPRTPSEETGLFPYRWVAWSGLIAYPTFMASLAFINGRKAYVSSGTFCTLPARPIWYRLALSWVPRYLILLVILGVYLAVYLYARFKFEEFGHRISDDSDGSLLTSPSGTMQETTRRAELVERKPDDAITQPTPTSRAHPPAQGSNARVLQSHQSIKRQLRLMFIYPTVYFVMSIPPFVNHCWLYTKVHSPPFALATCAVICLAGQCAADCILFMTREKPWRFVRKPSPLSRTDHGHERRRVRSDGIEMAPVRKRTAPRRGPDGSRFWWDQEAFSTDGTVREGSSAGTPERVSS